MSRAQRLKKARHEAADYADGLPKPKAGRFAGASFWRVLASIIWPGVLEKPRARVQDGIDRLHEKAVKRAIKRTAKAVARRHHV